MKMSEKVGIPRALFYHTYYPLWRTFFGELGVETIVSPETNKGILNEGIKHVVDETCLPVKVFFGHIAELNKAGVDYLFVPRMVSVEKKAYICPKFMGLPDMLKASKLAHPAIIMPVINLVKAGQAEEQFILECAAPFTGNRRLIKKAWRVALQEQQGHEENLRKKALAGDAESGSAVRRKMIDNGLKNDDLTILLLGHDYNVYDRYINMGIMEKLRHLGCQVVTSALLSKEEREVRLKQFPRSVFWTYGRNLMGAVFRFFDYAGKKGVIILSSFGCGIDSFIDHFIIRRLAAQKIPYLNVVLDEHTGEGGLNTRLEAFIDIIQWRRDYHQNYISTYGQYMGRS
jgi:predicted nucleotide-binding protein (sugar kinase/HSP70/actin superfamily)